MSVRKDGTAYLTPGEVSERLGVSRQRVNVLLHEHRVKRLAVHARLFLIPEGEVRRLERIRKESGRTRPKV